LPNGTAGSQIIPGTELTIEEDKSDFQILPEKEYSDAGYVDMVFRHSDSTEDVGGYLRPTFHDPPPQTSTPKRIAVGGAEDNKPPDSPSAGETPPTVIATQSYVTQQSLRESCDMLQEECDYIEEKCKKLSSSANSSTTTESHPLVVLNGNNVSTDDRPVNV